MHFKLRRGHLSKQHREFQQRYCIRHIPLVLPVSVECKLYCMPRKSSRRTRLQASATRHSPRSHNTNLTEKPADPLACTCKSVYYAMIRNFDELVLEPLWHTPLGVVSRCDKEQVFQRLDSTSIPAKEWAFKSCGWCRNQPSLLGMGATLNTLLTKSAT